MAVNELNGEKQVLPHRNCPLVGGRSRKGQAEFRAFYFSLFPLILVGEDTLNTFLVLLAAQQIGVLAQRLQVLGPQESLVFPETRG